MVWLSLLSLLSRNNSNKCTFTLKVSLLVLLVSLDLSLVDCKLNSLCDPEAIPLQTPGSNDGPRLGSCLQCVAVTHVPLPNVRLAFSLSLC